MITKIDNITYLLDSAKKCATVTKSLEPYSGAVVIPASVEVGGVEFQVTDILDEAFMECTALTSVVLVALVLFTPLAGPFGLMTLPVSLYLEGLGLIFVPLVVMECSKAFGLIKHQH